MQEHKITIGTGTIFKTLAILGVLYLLFLVWDIVLVVFVSLMPAAVIDPFASWFERRRIPRGLSVIAIYIVLFGVLGLAIALLAPIVAHDLPGLVSNMEQLWADMQHNEMWQRVVSGVQQTQQFILQLQGASSAGAVGSSSGALSGVFSTISGVASGIVSLVLVLVITFYLVVQDDPMRKIVHSFLPADYVPYIVSLLKRMRDKLSLWIRGQLLLSLIIGVLVGIGLSILQVKYALVLGLLAALFEFVPYAGPIMAAIPALFLAFSHGGPVSFVAVFCLYIVIQQIENHILVPKVMQKAVGLNPVISILAVLIGAKLAGVLGALLAIPVATALSVFVSDIITHNTASPPETSV